MTAQAYDRSMTTRITVSLPDHLVEQVKRAVEDGQAPSVSAYVAEALQERVPPIGLKALLRQWDDELGPPSAADRAWAKSELERVDREMAARHAEPQ